MDKFKFYSDLLIVIVVASCLQTTNVPHLVITILVLKVVSIIMDIETITNKSPNRKLTNG